MKCFGIEHWQEHDLAPADTWKRHVICECLKNIDRQASRLPIAYCFFPLTLLSYSLRVHSLSWCGRQGSRNTRWLSTLHMWSGSTGSREMNSGTHHLLFLPPSWDPSPSDSATYIQGLPFSVKYLWEYTHRYNQRCMYLLECLTLPMDNED